jgi:hypothetical protein
MIKLMPMVAIPSPSPFPSPSNLCFLIFRRIPSKGADPSPLFHRRRRPYSQPSFTDCLASAHSCTYSASIRSFHSSHAKISNLPVTQLAARMTMHRQASIGPPHRHPSIENLVTEARKISPARIVCSRGNGGSPCIGLLRAPSNSTLPSAPALPVGSRMPRSLARGYDAGLPIPLPDSLRGRSTFD